MKTSFSNPMKCLSFIIRSVVFVPFSVKCGLQCSADHHVLFHTASELEPVEAPEMFPAAYEVSSEFTGIKHLTEATLAINNNQHKV